MNNTKICFYSQQKSNGDKSLVAQWFLTNHWRTGDYTEEKKKNNEELKHEVKKRWKFFISNKIRGISVQVSNQKICHIISAFYTNILVKLGS